MHPHPAAGTEADGADIRPRKSRTLVPSRAIEEHADQRGRTTTVGAAAPADTLAATDPSVPPANPPRP